MSPQRKLITIQLCKFVNMFSLITCIIQIMFMSITKNLFLRVLFSLFTSLRTSSICKLFLEYYTVPSVSFKILTTELDYVMCNNGNHTMNFVFTMLKGSIYIFIYKISRICSILKLIYFYVCF